MRASELDADMQMGAECETDMWVSDGANSFRFFALSSNGKSQHFSA